MFIKKYFKKYSKKQYKPLIDQKCVNKADPPNNNDLSDQKCANKADPPKNSDSLDENLTYSQLPKKRELLDENLNKLDITKDMCGFATYQNMLNLLNRCNKINPKTDNFGYKVVNLNFCNKDFTYQLGLNVDTKKFSKHFEYTKKYGFEGYQYHDGLHFSNAIDVLSWILIFQDAYPWDKEFHYNFWIAVVELCPDAEFFVDDGQTQYRTNKLIVNEFITVDQFVQRLTYEQQLSIIKRSPFTLRLFKQQTHEMCALAIDNAHHCILEYIINQTPELIIMALSENVNACHYVKDEKIKNYLFSIFVPGSYYLLNDELYQKLKTMYPPQTNTQSILLFE